MEVSWRRNFVADSQRRSTAKKKSLNLELARARPRMMRLTIIDSLWARDRQPMKVNWRQHFVADRPSQSIVED